jgi:phosphate transport system substrate-binding protein
MTNFAPVGVDRTRIPVIVHSTNPVRSLTLEQITQILEGSITNWKALGGPDTEIKVVLVGGGGGVTVAVQAALLKGEEARASNKLYSNTPVQLVRIVEQEPGAIGFAQLALVRRGERSN